MLYSLISPFLPFARLAQSVSASLEEKKFQIHKRHSSLAKLDLLVSALNYKIYHERHLMQKNLKTQMPQILEDIEIDNHMEEVKKVHEQNLANLEDQRNALREESEKKIEELDSHLKQLTKKCDDLITSLEKGGVGKTFQEVKDIRKKVTAYKLEIKKLTELQFKGWKDLTDEEYLAG